MNSYDTLKKELDEKTFQLHKLNEEAGELKIKLHKEALNEVFKENLLNCVTWEASRYAYTHPENKRWILTANNLESQIKDASKYARLEQLFHTDYYCETKLTPTAKIRWEDDELTILFEDMDAVKEFCLKNSLHIDITCFQININDYTNLIAQSHSKIHEIKSFLNFLEVNSIPTVNSLHEK